MAELSPWYITGFCDGEAAFTYSRAGGSFAIYFGITQKADNRQIIDAIQEYFGFVGQIYQRKETVPGKHSGLTKSSVYYRTTRIDELTAIIDHFDKYPLQSEKKKKAYNVWREMVLHKIDNYRNTNYDKLRELAEKLSNLNSKSRAFKVHSH